MFGFVKKDDVITLVEKEVELNRRMYEKYTDLLNVNSTHTEEGACYKKEAERWSAMAEEYFTRWQEGKEILKKIKDL